MPQLNPLDWAPQVIWLLITFGVLYLLMVWVAIPRIGTVIDKRAARIAGDLEAAEKNKRETEEANRDQLSKVFAVLTEIVGRGKLRGELRPDADANRLREQFGQEYRHSRDFKKEFRQALRQVLVVYPDARLEEVMGGLLLYPSRPPLSPTVVGFSAPRIESAGG